MVIRVEDRSPTRETASWHSMPTLDMDVINARYVQQEFPLHFHETYVVCVDERGAHASWYRGANLVVPERFLTLVTPGEVHTGHRVPGQVWHYRGVYPSVEVMRQLAQEAGVETCDVALAGGLSVDDASLTEAFLAAHRASVSDPGSLEAECAMTEVLVRLLRRHAEGLRRPTERPAVHLIRVIRDYIEAHLAERITLQQLAQSTGLSRYAVLRVFRRTLGIPPHQFLILLRVRRAEQLLRRGLPPAIAAQMVGFSDQSHLNRHFRRLIGVTPGAYARRR
jgi:AraC-like DNA-binding protein